MRLTAVFACAALLTLSPPPCFAQAGSIGGTIGKTNKSVSGGDEKPRQRTTPKKRASLAATEDQASFGKGCARVVGRWTGWGNITIRANGTWQIAGGGAADDAGRWVCNGNSYVFRSPTSGLEARYTLSQDGNTLNGSSSMTGFAIAWPLQRAQ